MPPVRLRRPVRHVVDALKQLFGKFAQRPGPLESPARSSRSAADSSSARSSDAIEDSPRNRLELSDRLWQLKRELNLGLSIVNTLQLIRSGMDSKSSRTIVVPEVVRSLKNLAKELDMPPIAGSQLKRRSDMQPVLGDLPGSGAIEDHADVILFIYRDEVFDHDSPHKFIADITVAKKTQRTDRCIPA